MAKKLRTRADRHKSLDSLLMVGVGLVFATIPVGISIVFFLEQSLHPDHWELANTGVLIASAIVLELLWLKVPLDERLLLLDLGEELFPTTPGFALPAVIVSDAAFLTLTVLAIWPPAFALMLLGIKLVESWNAYLFKKYLDDRLQVVWASTELPASQSARGIDLQEWKRQAGVLNDYYFERPWYALAVTETVAVAVASCVAVYAARDPDPSVRHGLGAFATVVLILAVVGNEIFASIWRGWRDRDVDQDLEEGQVPMPRVSRRDYLATTTAIKPATSAAAGAPSLPTAQPFPARSARPGRGSSISIAKTDGVGLPKKRMAGKASSGQSPKKPRAS